MSRILPLYEFIRTYFNLVAHDDHGRMIRDQYENGLGQSVTVELWDSKPAAIYRDGLEPIFEKEVMSYG